MEFTIPFKPEELLAQPADGRLWAADLPDVESWSEKELNKALDKLVGQLLTSQGKDDLADSKAFSLLFAVLQAWQRLEEGLHPRVVDLLTDAAKRLIAEAGRLKKPEKASKDKNENSAKALRTAAKVAAFFLRWTSERLLSTKEDKRPRRREKKAGTALQQAEQAAALEEAKEANKALERQRTLALQELAGLVARGAMPWLWLSDPAAWQQAANACSDAGFLALDCAEALKSRETKQAALQCVAVPLLQEGQQHSNLLVATVSKLLHGLRAGEGAASFAADCLLQAHTTPLPRLFLVELTQHCTPQELSSQGAFQRSLAGFLVALSERLPHVVLANISVLLPLLDVDCYPIRQAIVESIGQLLAAEGKALPSGAHNAEEQQPEGEGEAVLPSNSGTFTLAPATKNDLLETLFTRFLDKSVWVRYRVLQTLNSLASNGRSLPRELWPRVLDLAIRRMQDTASMSRKAAMQLVRKLVEFHPYGPALKGSGDESAKAEKLLKEIQDRLNKLKAEELAELEGGADGADDEALEQPEKRRRCKGKTDTEMSIAKEVDKDLSAEGGDQGGADSENASARHEARERQREALQRMQQCYAQRVHFVELLDAAEARLRQLLSSKTPTDVTEAISVVVELRLRGVPAATRAFQQVLGLVWSRHAPIKDAAVDAFYRMHLEGRDARSSAAAILQIYQDDGFASGTLTHTHLASVQELIQQAADKELISTTQVVTTLLGALSEGASSGSFALRALTALVASKQGHFAMAQGLQKLAEYTARPGSPGERLESSRLVCQLLLRFCANPGTDHAHVARLCAVSQQCTFLVVQHFVKGEVPPQWFSAAMCAMETSPLNLPATASLRWILHTALPIRSGRAS
ncbi:unnamed protein product [Effrenium voratum]|nr:unnamed protein product [Effrenium voratum]